MGQMMRIIIIGGSAGGASVAARLRRLNENAHIIIFEKSTALSFATCGSPYYLGNVITDRERLFVVDQEEFSSILNVDVRLNSKVICINRQKKTIVVNDYAKNFISEEAYDKLVLAPGGVPKRLQIPGERLSHVFTLRNAGDTDAIKHFISNSPGKKAVVVGAGFVGMEVADNLRNIGLGVTVVDASDQVLNTWDKEVANVVHSHVLTKGVHIILNSKISAINTTTVQLGDGQEIEADIVILALGVVPNTWLAKTSGITLGEHGGIRVNEGMVTNDEHIYALGDAVEVRHKLTQAMTINPLAGVAHKQARIVADNICGMHRSYKETQHTAIAKVFDLTIALTGSSEKILRQNQVQYKKSFIQAPSHAGYYPNSHNMLIKLLFAAKTGRLLGAQVVGVAGVDKRIDVLASAIQHGKIVSDLMELELAYAPPYSSAKDPVNVAGMVAHNMLVEEYEVVHWDELDSFDTHTTILLDVRTPEEYEVSSLDGAINIPLNELRTRMAEIPRDKRVLVFCQVGKKGYFAYKILKQSGFKDVYNLSGGLYVAKMAKKQFQEEAKDPVKSNPIVSTHRPVMPILVSTLNHPELSQNTKMSASNTTSELELNCEVIEINACGLSCPGPMLQLSKTMKKARPGDVVKISATDIGFSGDLMVWCKKNGHELLEFDNSTATITAMLKKA